MSDGPTKPEPPADAKEAEEAERVRQWREERAKVAEEQKQDRVREAREARQKELEAEAEAQRETAKQFLPDAAAIATARQSVLARAAGARRMLGLQLLVIVALPTLAAIIYAGWLATPLYEAQSIVVIAKAGRDSDAGLGGLLGAVGGSPANLQEAFMAHEFVQSQALMDRLETDIGLVSRYSGPQMDFVWRLRDMPSLGISKRALFSRFVDSSINIQTGLMTLFVRAPSSGEAQQVSQLILDRVAERINALSAEMFDERILQAEGAVRDAHAALLRAQSDLTQLQIKSGEANPQLRIVGIYAAIQQLETQMQDLRSQMAATKVAGEGNATYQTKRLKKLERDLLGRIEDQRRLLVDGKGGADGRALNTLLLEYELAVLQVRVAEETLSTSRLALLQTNEKAALGRSHFQIVVPPKTAAYPRYPNIAVTGLIVFFTMLSGLSVYRLLRSTKLK